MLDRIGTRLSARLGQPPPGETWRGDDAAVVTVASAKGTRLLLSIDAVVAGVHFDPALVTSADVGWKALTVAVSDIAAMGGTPGHALVSLSGPPGVDVDGLAEGLGEAARRWACPVVGGDLTGAVELVVVVAVTGTAEGEPPPVLRSGAKPGDRLYVTGPLGRSAAGLRLLRDPATEEPHRRQLEQAHRRPEARLAEGRAARFGGASAMMDLSDGLGLDLHRLARASGVGAELDEVPVADGATFEEAVGGGEDYELLVAAPDEQRLAASFEAAGLRPPLRLGRVTAEVGVLVLGGEPLPPSGFEHRL